MEQYLLYRKEKRQRTIKGSLPKIERIKSIMEDIKVQIELKLIAVQLSDWCKHREGIIFQSSLCSQERCIRFTTPLLLEIFPNMETQVSAWKSGCFFLYEIYNGVDTFQITCSVSYIGLNSKQKKECQKLIESCGASEGEKQGVYFLRCWNYPEAARNLPKIMEAMQDFSEFEMPYFEKELTNWKKNPNYRIKTFPNISQVLLPREELPEELLIEGSMKDILTNQYERNRTARKRCLAVHGTTCNICGFDFGVVYGSEFAGKIEVHHKIPLYKRKENYVVDPVKDLIPVCPNCHLILHSKPDGFYTVEEVKEMLGKESKR